MSAKKSRAKKEKKAARIISVEGSRELEPQLGAPVSPKGNKTMKLSPKALTLISLMIVVLMLLISIPAYYFYQYTTQKNSGENSEAYVKSLTSEVGRIMMLPTGETPTVATVSDKSKLAGQQFFSNAQNGDKVLIYTNAKRAILYRPAIKKIVEVGPINLTGDAGNSNAKVAGASSSATITPALVRVGLLNGTSVVGLTKKIEPTLMSKVPGVQVTVKENAFKNDYPETLVIAPSQAQSAAAQQIAKALGGKVVPLPTGEAAPPNTDITVILGQKSSQ